ncbi:DMT family transporter, partial [Polaromonas sp. CG_9.11]|uniref:DMT family transporter n=1 Tax=Polaromonas sp. CG_9.11 TaxID=2787730 RepID=UPI0018C9D585
MNSTTTSITTTSSQFSGSWRMALAMAISGTIGLFVIESGQSPLVVVFIRCLIGALGLAAWLTLTGAWTRMSLVDVAWTVGGGLSLVLNWLCLFSSYRYSSVSVATVTYHTQPFMLLAIVAILKRESLVLFRLPWLGLAFSGVVLTSQFHTNQEAGSNWIGAGLACSAAFLYAVATLVTRQLKHLPPAQIAVFQLLVGVLILLPLSINSIEPMTPCVRLVVASKKYSFRRTDNNEAKIFRSIYRT